MAILKEYTCRKCGHEFEAFVPTCARCGYDDKENRAFRTPAGINGGRATFNSAKRIDRLIENEFSRQGISNFSNRGGINKVEYAKLRQKAPGVYATPFAGAEVAPIQAGFVNGGLTAPDLRSKVPFIVDGKQWDAPTDTGVSTEFGARVGNNAAQSLRNRTNIVGRTDSRGNQIP